jgi:hypothetical protein
MSARADAFPGLAAFAPRISALPERQRRIWPRLAQLPLDAVLYGDSALALRLGHRASLDFDLFVPHGFAPRDLFAAAPFLRAGSVVQSAPDTLVVRIDDVRISLFGVDIGAVADPELATDNALPVASLRDLGATKAKTLLDRAESKDYLDLGALLEAGLPLEGMLADAAAIFGPSFNSLLALKAATYFEEGDLPELPPAVMARLRRAAAGVARIPVVRPLHSRILPDGLPRTGPEER